MATGNRRIRQLALAACVLGAAPLPAFAAGSIYVPLPGEPVPGFDWNARVIVANRGKVNHVFTHLLLPLDSDGTKRPSAASAPSHIPGGDTAVLDLAAAGAGLLELSGAQQFAYTGQLVRAGEPAPLAVALPTITTENMALAHERLFLQGWLRVGTKATDLSIVNLGHEAAQCTVRYYRANGTEVAAAVTINMAPLSHRIYRDVLAILGVVELSDVRGDVTCTQTFYTFALVRDNADGEIAVIEPSALGEHGLQDPGGGAPGVCPPEAFKCFSRPGIFFIPTKKVPFGREVFPLPEGAYSKVHYRSEVFHAGWQKPNSGLHHFFWLSVNGQQFRLLGMGYALGPGKNQMLFRHGDKILSTSKPRLTPHFAPTPGKTYVVDYTYDTVGRKISFVITEKNGDEVFRYDQAKPNVNFVHVESYEVGLVADFSTHNTHHNEPATIGWQYSNLTLTVWK